MNNIDISNGAGQNRANIDSKRTCRLTTVGLPILLVSVGVAKGMLPMAAIGIGVLVFALFTIGSWALREAVRLNA